MKRVSRLTATKGHLWTIRSGTAKLYKSYRPNRPVENALGLTGGLRLSQNDDPICVDAAT